MTIQDMEYEISYSIDNMRLTSRHIIDDIIRLLKVKRGLLLVDPARKTRRRIIASLFGRRRRWSASKRSIHRSAKNFCKEFLEEVSMWKHQEVRTDDVDKSSASKAAENGVPLRGFAGLYSEWAAENVRL